MDQINTSRFTGAGYLQSHPVKVGGEVIGYVAKSEGRVLHISQGGGREAGTWSAFRADGFRIARGLRTRAAAAILVRT